MSADQGKDDHTKAQENGVKEHVLPVPSNHGEATTKLITEEADIIEILEPFQILSAPEIKIPYMFIDLKGVNLRHQGQISFVQILIPPNPCVYLIDVLYLGDKAFTTKRETGPSWGNRKSRSLGDVLGLTTIKKVFFDVRMSQCALFAHHKISFKGVIDIQLLEFASRSTPDENLNSLKECLHLDGRALRVPLWTKELAKKKAEGMGLSDPKNGGSEEVFLRRPLPQALLDYCLIEVLMLPGLLQLYGKRLQIQRVPGLAAATTDRLEESRQPEYMKEADLILGPKELMCRE